jgi:hypothetical protein
MILNTGAQVQDEVLECSLVVSLVCVMRKLLYRKRGGQVREDGLDGN